MKTEDEYLDEALKVIQAWRDILGIRLPAKPEELAENLKKLDDWKARRLKKTLNGGSYGHD